MNHLDDIRQATILLVDDTPENLGVLEHALREQGFTVLVARDGESGVAKAQYARPDIILLDIIMPGLDGFATCARLKVDARTKEIPVIFMTVLTDTIDKVKGFEVGGVDYVTKPIDHVEVLARVTTHLTMSRLRQQLQKEYERFRTLSEAMFDGLVIYKEGTVLDFNQAIEKMFGYQREELLGKPKEGLVTPGSRPMLQEHLHDKMPQPYQVNGLRKNGSHFPIEIRAQDMEYQGCHARVAIIRDMSREYALKRKTQELEAENVTLKASLDDRCQFGEIIGKSPAMRKVYERIIRAAAVDETVIIYGETGTGKELAARTIFQLSESHTKTFVPVNCSAIQENLVESQFFGHRKGAFTGALRDAPGYFDQAQGGMLFLDEVGELSLPMQAKLLRVLQENEYTPVGSTISRKADVRIIAATNRDLGEMVKAETMRQDFFHRLHVITVKLPPLRWRKEDIPLLIEHFFAQRPPSGAARPTIPPDILEQFYAYDWPGNVRELFNELRRYAATGELELGGHHPPQVDAISELDFLQEGMSLTGAVDAFEHYYITRVLRQHQGQKALTAQALGVGRKTLYNKLKKYGELDSE